MRSYFITIDYLLVRASLDQTLLKHPDLDGLTIIVAVSFAAEASAECQDPA
jgi:hypothetical protein